MYGSYAAKKRRGDDDDDDDETDSIGERGCTRIGFQGSVFISQFIFGLDLCPDDGVHHGC